MKAIILARVSSKEQEDNNSIPAQTRRLQEYVSRLDYQLLETFQLVESSTKANRRKFTELIKQIDKSKETICLVVDTIDRLQRDFKESVTLDELRKQSKVELHFVREGLIISKDSNSADIMRWDMGVLFAKSYVTQLSDNVKRSAEQKRIDGEWGHKAPFGYRNVDLASGKKWIDIDPSVAPCVKDIFRLYASGAYSMPQIQQKIFEIYGLSKPISAIYKILKNTFYYGVMKINGEYYSHKYEPLIAKEMYDTVQKYSNRPKKDVRKYAGLPFLYRGLITCGECGYSVTPEYSKGYAYYHCTQYGGKHKASYVREESLTEQMNSIFNDITPSESQYQEVIDALRLSNRDKMTYKSRRQSALNSELTKVDNRMSRLYDSYLDGDIEKDFYKSKSRELKEQKQAIVHRLKDLDSADEHFYENAENIMSLVRNGGDIFKSSELDEKRQLLKLILQNLELHGRELRWKYKKPFDTMASYSKNSSWQGIMDVFQENLPLTSLSYS